MDYGDDPLVATRYAREHARAQEALRPDKASLLCALRTRNEWKDMSLPVLRDLLVTPDMMVAARCSWGALQAKHGAAALLDFGFRWPTMLAGGFRGTHLASLSKAQVSELGLTAPRMLECQPTPAQVAALRFTADELHNLGWDAAHLHALGVDMKSMADFGFPLAHWRDALGMTAFAQLGFTNYADCVRAGWRGQDVELALAQVVVAAPVVAAAAAPAVPGKIRWV
jgi:hypothetical protein